MTEKVCVETESVNKPETQVIKSIYSGVFPYIINKLGISLVISTYQANKLINLHSQENEIRLEFCSFANPMGVATYEDRLTVGVRGGVWELRNLASQSESAEKHDACYVPFNYRVTGGIHVHDLQYVGSELWFVNTVYSCLCTLHDDYNFVPQWQPQFVTKLVAEDRCHLNGLCLIDGKPKYVTAFGTTDSKDGWRKNKANGGIIIDINSNEIVAKNLSMPHSPRWHNGNLWFLESGRGSLAKVDLDTGKIETIVELPGFTRGLDFFGNFAFVGLSETREQKVFDNIPLSERLDTRAAGIWIIDLKTGNIVSYLQFADTVREIYEVKVLAGIRQPEILQHNSKKAAEFIRFPQ